MKINKGLTMHHKNPHRLGGRRGWKPAVGEEPQRDVICVYRIVRAVAASLRSEIVI